MSIELAWVTISTVGLLVAVWGVLDAWGDKRAIENRRNGRRIIATGYVRSELITTVIQTILLLIGISPLLDPDPVHGSRTVYALITVNLLLCAKSVLNARDRLRVRKAAFPPPTEL